MGPVVSCDPTLVTVGSQYVPGTIPSFPHAFPTIFCARVKEVDCFLSKEFTGVKILTDFLFKVLFAFSVRDFPIIRLMRPFALTLSKILFVL